MAMVIMTAQTINAEISANKFDAQAIATPKGLAGQNNYGESSPPNKGLALNVSITPFFNSGNSSWNTKSSKDSSYQNSSAPSGSQTGSQPFYEYGVLEENGFWNAAGIFYGMAHLCIADIIQDIQRDAQNKETQVGIFCFAPTNMEFNGTTIGYGLPPTPNVEQDAIKIAEINPLIPESEWVASKYTNYYSALLKTAFPTLDNTKIEDLINAQIAANSANQTQIQPNTIPDHEKLKKNLATSSFEFESPSEETLKDIALIRLSPEVKKTGFRFCASASPIDGVDISFKAGLAEVRAYAKDCSPISSTALEICRNKAILESALSDLGLSIKEYRHSGLEDCYASISVNQGLDLRDNDNNVVASIIPIASVGCWIPTSHNYAEAHGNKNALYIPLGNEGHTGMTAQAGLALDLKGMISFSVLGGTTIFNEISIDNYRMPNDVRQIGLYPFCINVKRKKGQIYYGCVSIKSIGFEDGVNFYGDLIFITHKKDKFTLVDANSYRNDAFAAGKTKYEDNSAWTSLDFNVGLSYNFTKELQCGIGMTSNIKGTAVPRMKTIFFNTAFLF